MCSSQLFHTVHETLARAVCAFLEGGPCGFRRSQEERNKTQDSHSWLMISPRELLPVAAWCTLRVELDA